MKNRRQMGRGKKGRCGCRMLNEVRPGEKVCIRCHHACGAIRQRLLDLGFVPSARVDVIRRAPLGDPIQLKVNNYNVTLRKSEAAQIEIEAA